MEYVDFWLKNIPFNQGIDASSHIEVKMIDVTLCAIDRGSKFFNIFTTGHR
jgi:hypothetical protein